MPEDSQASKDPSGLVDPIAIIFLVGSLLVLVFPNLLTGIVVPAWLASAIVLIAVAVCDYTGLISQNHKLQRYVLAVFFIIALSIATYSNNTCLSGNWTWVNRGKFGTESCQSS